MRIAVIGLGRIGLGVSALLVRAGHDVIGFDVATIPAEQRPGGLAIAPTARVAAEGADCLLVAVYDDEQVMATFAGSDSVITCQVLAPVAAILSTVALETVREVHQRASSVGMEVIDCGVSGGEALKRGQRLAVAAGGDRAAINRVRPVLDAFATPVLYMGPLGSGMAAKLARNLIHYCSALADWEATQLAYRAGLDIEQFIEFAKQADRLGSGRMGTVSPLGAGALRPEQRLALFAHKDLQAALDLAADLGLSLPVAALASVSFGRLVSG